MDFTVKIINFTVKSFYIPLPKKYFLMQLNTTSKSYEYVNKKHQHIYFTISKMRNKLPRSTIIPFDQGGKENPIITYTYDHTIKQMFQTDEYLVPQASSNSVKQMTDIY